MRSRIICRAIWIPSLIALVALLGFDVKLAPAAPPPEPLKPFVSTDKLISMNAPGNWKPKEMALHGIETDVKFSPGDGVVFAITADLAGSLMADMDKAMANMQSSMMSEGAMPSSMQQQPGMASGPSQPVPGAGSLPGMPSLPTGPRKSTLEKLHAAQAKLIDKVQTEFEDGQTQKIQVAGHEALITSMSFTVEKGFSRMRVVGDRVTFLSGERRFSIIYRCRKEDETKLRPIFRQMLDSLRVNEQGGQ